MDARKGVLITGVDDGSLAALSNLQAGDVIVEADHKPVSSVEELQSALSKDKDQILLLVTRKSGNLFLVFRLK